MLRLKTKNLKGISLPLSLFNQFKNQNPNLAQPITVGRNSDFRKQSLLKWGASNYGLLNAARILPGVITLAHKSRAILIPTTGPTVLGLAEIRNDAREPLGALAQ